MAGFSMLREVWVGPADSKPQTAFVTNLPAFLCSYDERTELPLRTIFSTS
jgi:hypothetical protein